MRICCCFFFFFKQKTAYEMCGRDWSSDVCSSDLLPSLSLSIPCLPFSVSSFSLSLSLPSLSLCFVYIHTMYFPFQNILVSNSPSLIWSPHLLYIHLPLLSPFCSSISCLPIPAYSALSYPTSSLSRPFISIQPNLLCSKNVAVCIPPRISSVYSC